ATTGTGTVVSAGSVSEVAVVSATVVSVVSGGVVVAGASVVATGGGGPSVVVVWPGSVIGGTWARTCDAPPTSSTAAPVTANAAAQRNARISGPTPDRPGASGPAWCARPRPRPRRRPGRARARRRGGRGRERARFARR